MLRGRADFAVDQREVAPPRRRRGLDFGDAVLHEAQRLFDAPDLAPEARGWCMVGK